jgi:hypothetical protein
MNWQICGEYLDYLLVKVQLYGFLKVFEPIISFYRLLPIKEFFSSPLSIDRHQDILGRI